MRLSILMAGLLGTLALSLVAVDVGGLFTTEASRAAKEPVLVNTTMMDKTHRRQELVMMYEPRISFKENLKKNIMSRLQAEAELASGLHPGGQIVGRVGNGYLLPAVSIVEVQELRRDGTPVEEGVFHDEEERASSAIAKK